MTTKRNPFLSMDMSDPMLFSIAMNFAQSISRVTKEAVEKWKSEKKISYDNDARRGYIYQDQQQTEEEMVEFHVDDFDMLHDVVAEEMGFGTFGGHSQTARRKAAYIVWARQKRVQPASSQIKSNGLDR
ncbi:hypothetical protein MHU86_23464 [Fragilaria crotonensis]|nr:hypothetical protein MHU86_23464 [Fragilaria crotonensis]